MADRYQIVRRNPYALLRRTDAGEEVLLEGCWSECMERLLRVAKDDDLAQDGVMAWGPVGPMRQRHIELALACGFEVGPDGVIVGARGQPKYAHKGGAA